MSTPRSREKSKRVLPNIPFKPRQEGSKHSKVVFEMDKNDKVPSKAISGERNEESKKQSAILKQNGSSQSTIEQQVEILNQEQDSNCESDKENCEDTPRKVKLSVNTQVTYGTTSCNLLSTGAMHDNFNSPSPNMKMLQRTPLRRHTMDEKVFNTPECYKYVQFEQPYYNDFGDSDRNDDGEDSCGVTVAVRVRPFSSR